MLAQTAQAAAEAELSNAQAAIETAAIAAAIEAATTAATAAEDAQAAAISAQTATTTAASAAETASDETTTLAGTYPDVVAITDAAATAATALSDAGGASALIATAETAVDLATDAKDAADAAVIAANAAVTAVAAAQAQADAEAAQVDAEAAQADAETVQGEAETIQATAEQALADAQAAIPVAAAGPTTIEIVDGNAADVTSIVVPTCSVSQLHVQAKEDSDVVDATGTYTWSSADDVAITPLTVNGTSTYFQTGSDVTASDVTLTVSLDDPSLTDTAEASVIDNLGCFTATNPAGAYDFGNTFEGRTAITPTVDAPTTAFSSSISWYGTNLTGHSTITRGGIVYAEGINGANALHLETAPSPGADTTYSRELRAFSAGGNGTDRSPIMHTAKGSNAGKTYNVSAWVKINYVTDLLDLDLTALIHPWGSGANASAKANEIPNVQLTKTIMVNDHEYQFVDFGNFTVPTDGVDDGNGWTGGWPNDVFFGFILTPPEGEQESVYISNISITEVVAP